MTAPLPPWARAGGVPLAILLALFAVLAVAGGASRADALGQGIVRGAALLAVAGLVATGARFRLRELRAPLAILGAAALLVFLQLVPLPPGLWAALPGRGLFAEVARAAGVADAWRPVAVSPDAALNALLSLVVPAAVLAGVSALDPEARRASLPALLGVAVASALVALAQVAAGGVDNPFVNDVPGLASGLLANRNHQALLLSIGVLLALAWGFDPARPIGWRGWTALGIAPLLALMVLASGSRAGLLLVALALGAGLAIARRGLGRATRRLPRWGLPAAAALAVVAAAALVLASVESGRALSLDRLFAAGLGEDMRTTGRPTVLALVGRYFPLGSGAGSFDAVFRAAEPFDLLKPTYFNHAHNDYLQVALEFGLPGLLLLGAALAWWAQAAWKAWRSGDAVRRAGAGVILLVLVASVVDYPARTPLVMAALALAGAWTTLPEPPRDGRRSRAALPGGRA